jgi:hypothetical protein
VLASRGVPGAGLRRAVGPETCSVSSGELLLAAVGDGGSGRASTGGPGHGSARASAPRPGEHGHLPGGPALHVAALEPVQRVLGDLAPAVVDRERVATVLEVHEVRDRR